AVVKSMAAALKYAWESFGILHRDIKPGNIMIEKDGNAMLMDLGVSKSVNEDAKVTMTGVIVGSPAYLSPEQAALHPEIDFHADMYSLGITLYQLITGELPYDSNSPLSVISSHLHDPFPDCKEHNSKISRSCKQILERMVEKDPQNRYASWDNLVDDVDAALNKKPLPWGSHKKKRTQSKILQKLLPSLIILSGISYALSFASLRYFNKMEFTNACSLYLALSESLDFNSAMSAEEQTLKQDIMNGEWRKILIFENEHPRDINRAICMYKNLQKRYPGTIYDSQSKKHINTLKAKRMLEIQKVKDSMTMTIAELTTAGKFDEAEKSISNYSGNFPKETQTYRRQLIRLIAEKRKKYRKQSPASVTLSPIIITPDATPEKENHVSTFSGYDPSRAKTPKHLINLLKQFKMWLDMQNRRSKAGIVKKLGAKQQGDYVVCYITMGAVWSRIEKDKQEQICDMYWHMWSRKALSELKVPSLEHAHIVLVDKSNTIIGGSTKDKSDAIWVK
ncbi:MAG: serine/threonine protein kinase, partial [Lentisphaeria bacterium]|nr:serine/threonine protein kinase [Lentisphaeria bacterium]NQZ67227.1 serine/threonine protein kinase [Lentisphaeria bacterium]